MWLGQRTGTWLEPGRINEQGLLEKDLGEASHTPHAALLEDRDVFDSSFISIVAHSTHMKLT